MNTQTQSHLQEVDIKKIFVSKTNPRKTFEPEAMKELQESIEKVGVLQPILLRKHPTLWKEKIGEVYELVCGERRYLASDRAGLETIPANIRDLSDDEAFEMQIIENLERKDVHPLEEADAFKRMLESGKYQIADIAAKFAKPETFIAQRLKFVDLIDEIKKDFYDGKLGIGHAIHMARLDQEHQFEIYDEANGKRNRGYGTVQELKDSIEDDTYNLDEAPFDIHNGKLVKGVSACDICPKRSGANPTLFPDIDETDKCFDRICYKGKLEAHLTNEVAAIINEGKNIAIGVTWGEKSPDFISEICKQHNVKILTDSDYNRVWNDDENKAQKMLIVSGHNAGDVISIRLKASSSSASATQEPSVQDQINKIEERAKRALELDNVKIFNAIKEDKKLYDEYSLSDEPLTDLETKALWFLFKKEVPDYSSTWEYNNLIDCPDSYNDIREFEFYKNGKLEELKLNQLVRMAIKDKLTSMHEPNFEKCTKSKFYFEIIKEQMPQSVKAIVDAQNEIAQKRIVRTNAKLKELKASLPAEKPKKKPASKKSKKNA
jgi:ParB/RepB/Spo0J family partition protein